MTSPMTDEQAMEVFQSAVDAYDETYSRLANSQAPLVERIASTKPAADQAAATVIRDHFNAAMAERDAEIARLEGLAKVYRQAQLTAEERLCRMTASEQGWRKRCEHLEARAALGVPNAG